MSAEYTSPIRIPGISARLVVDADHDWWALGQLLAEGTYREQADFFLALAEEIQSSRADGLMQLGYLADLFNSDKDWDKVTVVWLLRELLIRLEEDE